MSRFRRLRGGSVPLQELLGGLTGGITSLPANLPIGIVALAPLGAAAASTGAVSALFASALGAGLFALLASTRGLNAGGSMPYALVVAASLSHLVALGILHPGADAIPVALVVVTLLTLLTALCQVALAATGAGRLVPLIPYPVVSGIRNAAALLMVVVQIRPALGLSAAAQGLQWLHPGAVVVAVTTLAFMRVRIRALRFVPPVVVGILAGSAVHYAIAAFAGAHGMGRLAGPLLASPPSGPEQLRALAAGWAMLPGLPLGTLLLALLPAALSIALLSMMDTLASASVIQDRSGEHGSARGDLRALSVANVAAGLGGGLPIAAGVAVSFYVWDAGGRGPVAGLVRAAVLFVAVMLFTSVIGWLPVAVVAGMVIGNAWRVCDQEPLALLRKVAKGHLHHRAEIAANLAVMAVMPAVAVAFGMIDAVFAGILLSLVLFAATMATSAVRRRYPGTAGLSRTRRSEQETAILLADAGAIEVVELHGAVFFGSADQLTLVIQSALERGASHVILDFQRVSRIDLSGARRLVQVANRLWQSGVDLALASMQPASPIWAYLDHLELLGQLRQDRVFPTLEAALADAEEKVLAAHGAAPRPGTPEEALRRLGLPDASVTPLLAYMQECRFEAGARIIAAGAVDRTLYVLLEGRAEVTVVGPDSGVRLATLAEATLFGEMALVSAAPRSADIVALTPLRCLSMDEAAMARLRREQPELAYHLIVAVAAQAARNLRVANAALLSLAS